MTKQLLRARANSSRQSASVWFHPASDDNSNAAGTSSSRRSRIFEPSPSCMNGALPEPVHEVWQRNFGILNLRMPLLFPLKRQEPIVVNALQGSQEFTQRKFAFSHCNVLPVFTVAPQILDVDMANRKTENRSAVTWLHLARNETVRGILDNANTRRGSLAHNVRGLAIAG